MVTATGLQAIQRIGEIQRKDGPPPYTVIGENRYQASSGFNPTVMAKKLVFAMERAPDFPKSLTTMIHAHLWVHLPAAPLPPNDPNFLYTGGAFLPDPTQGSNPRR